MSKLHQLGPAVFNIGSEIQAKMVTKLLDERFGYTEKDIEALWRKTQEEFVGGVDPPHRSSAVYKYSKLYKKKKAGAFDHYSKKLKTEYANSGMDGYNISLLEESSTLPDDYGKIQTIINTFLYKKKKNDYYEWALDTKAFNNFGQELMEMYTGLPKDSQRLRKEIAENNKKFEIEARAGLIEASLNITRQCLASCGRKPLRDASCYICGEIIDSESGEDASGSQCEHVVPVTSLAALCGLSGPDYEKTIDAYFGDSETSDGNGTQITRTAYNLWRKILIGEGVADPKRIGEEIEHGAGKSTEGVMYRWAHPACNMIKKDHAFLGLDWNAAQNDADWEEMTERGFPILDEVEYCDEDGIKYVLKCLANEPINGKRGGGGSNSSKWRDRFKDDIDAGDTPLGPEWVTKRYNAMKDNTMKWAMCGVLSRDVDLIGDDGQAKYISQYKKDSGETVSESEWPSFRTALCDLSMKILDFRVGEKIQLHYAKFVGKKIDPKSLHNIIEEWRKAEWIDLVGAEGNQDGGGPNRGKQRTSLKAKGHLYDRAKNHLKRNKEGRESKVREMRERGPGYHLLKELNDNKLLLPIYFDVFDAVTEGEDEETRICRAETMAENYRENFYDYVDTDALNYEMMVAGEMYEQGMDIDRGRSKRVAKKKKRPTGVKKVTRGKKKITRGKKKIPYKGKKLTKGKGKLARGRKRLTLRGKIL